MAFLVVLGVLLIAVAGGLVARAVSMSRVRIASQIHQIETYGFQTAESRAATRASSSVLLPRLNQLADKIGSRAHGRGILAPVDLRMLRAAGMYGITADRFQGYRVMATVGLPTVLLFEFLFTKAGGLAIPVVLACAGLCWLFPVTIVRARGQRRMNEVDRRLPELVDVLIATVEAGLGFAGSLQLVASRFDGPLGQELRLMLREQSMGLSTEQALSNLLGRCDTPSVRSFARAVTQGESLGVSIGSMLRNLASEVRKRRRQTLREKIMKAPVKMLFPLIFLIFPALFLVLLYPAAYNILHALGAG
jgi:tight adherence protein C